MIDRNEETFSTNEIDIKDLFLVLWNYKLFIILMSMVISASSVYYALSLPNIYTSSAILAPAKSSNTGSNQMGALVSQYSGLANIAGVDLPSGSSGGAKLAIETISSRSFLNHLINKYDFIAPGLLASMKYDENTQSIIYNNQIFIKESNEWVRDTPKGRKKIPSHIELYDTYISVISVNENIASGFIKLEVNHISPQFAFKLASSIVKEINDVTKKNDVAESLMAIEFLEDRLMKTRESGIKNKINSLIYSHLNRLMISDIKEDYILDILDPPFIAEVRTSPSRATICILASIIGTLFISLLVIIYHFNFSSLQERKN